MVGYDGSSTESALSHFVAGASAGFFARLLLQPFDVVKIRFQLQIEPISKKHTEAKYKSLPQAFLRVVHEEGLFALWKGHVPAQWLSVCYGTVQFATFEEIDKVVSQTLVAQGKLRHTLCGSLAGLFATAAAQPFDVVRTRLVAQSEPKIYTSVLQAFSSIIRNEGFFALYRGFLPSAMQIVPYAGLQFGVNRFCNEAWVAIGLSNSVTKPDQIQSFVCGGIAGVASKIVVYPLDVVKKRLQLRGFEYARRDFGKNVAYAGFLDCVLKIMKKESVIGFYKGLSPSLMKAGLASACNFAFYEFALKRFRAVSV